MINVIATIEVKDSRLDDFIEIFKSNVPNVLQEDGCIEYLPTVDFNAKLPSQVLDSSTVTVIEKWESFAHLQAHFVAPHMLKYKSEVKDLVESVSLKILKSA